MADKNKPDDLAENVVPEIVPHPTITRKFEAAPWHRTRKQFVRKHQWNHEIVEQIVKKRADTGSEQVIRVFGLPSSEYLDLLSMRDFCGRHKLKVVYLGFNASYTPCRGTGSRKPTPVDLYEELQAQRMIEASSFVHPSSILYPDRFELIRDPRSQSRLVLNQFNEFDVINLDICGCIIDPNKNRATDVLHAVSELLRWQSTRRLAPWLFFVTTFAAPDQVNREACQPLIDSVKANADAAEDFKTHFKAKASLEVEAFHTAFKTPGAALPPVDTFIRLFATALGKWLAARLQQPTPPAFLSMLPSYCFRHEGQEDPQLLSLAYLIEPAPNPGAPGLSPTLASPPDTKDRYAQHAKRLLAKSFAIRDLDELMKLDEAKRMAMADETEQLLIQCGFDATAVKAFISQQR